MLVLLIGGHPELRASMQARADIGSLVLRVMHTHQDDAALQLAGLMALYQLVAYDVGMATMLCVEPVTGREKSAAFILILRAMQLFPTYASLLVTGCALLAQLTADERQLPQRVAFGRQGGCEVLCKAMVHAPRIGPQACERLANTIECAP